MKVVKKRLVNVETDVYDVIEASPNNNFLVKTNSGHIVSHNCGMLDEMEFAKGASEQMDQSGIMQIYRSVKRRMESRYMKQGELPGILFLVSSKKSDHDFLESYVKTQVDNPNVYIIDQPLWKVKPASNYSGVYFNVAVGNRYVKSRIVNAGEDLKSLEAQSYRILEVPVEHRQAFELDIDSALMDIAGVSVSSKSKFIDYERLNRNYSERINPFKTDVIVTGLDDPAEIRDFFLPDKIGDEVRSLPGFMHLDTSLTGDRTGISYVAIQGTKKVDKYNRGTEVSVESEIDLVYRQVFSIGIQAPSNSEISFEKTRQFIYYLKSIGFNIKGVSADGYQSADTIQLLKVAGYQARLLSLDRTPAGYLALKSAINEERFDMLKLNGTLLETEIVNLERDSTTGKVDHPSDGSKDIADSMCGSLYGASLYKLSNHMKFAAQDTELLSTMMELDSITSDLTSELLGIDYSNVIVDNSYMSKRDDFIDW